MDDRLYRSRQDRMLAGVAGGLAELWGADPSLIRIVWALLVFLTGGLALLVYLVMAVVVPEGAPGPGPAAAWADPTVAGAGSMPARPRRRASGALPGGMIAGLVLVALGAFFLVREWWPQLDFDWFWPAMLIVVGVLVLVAAIGARPDDPGSAS